MHSIASHKRGIRFNKIKSEPFFDYKSKKGISPIIAAVLLIAFTLAIGGIVASWATSFSSQKLTQTEEKSDCIGALDISNLKFEGTTVSLKVKNLASRLNLTDIKASLEYSDPVKSKANNDIAMYDSTNAKVTGAISRNLAPGASDVFIYNTGDSTKPTKIQVVASNCLDNAVSLSFR